MLGASPAPRPDNGQLPVWQSNTSPATGRWLVVAMDRLELIARVVPLQFFRIARQPTKARPRSDCASAQGLIVPPAVRQQRLQTGPALEGDFTFTGSASNAWKATRRLKGTVQKGTVAPGRATVPQCRSGSGDTARGVQVLRLPTRSDGVVFRPPRLGDWLP